MLILIGSFRVDPARMADARPAMARMMAESAAEPGCIQYSYAQDLLDPGLFHITERWRDRDALSGHFTAPHLLEWRGERASLGITDCAITLYEANDGEAI